MRIRGVCFIRSYLSFRPRALREGGGEIFRNSVLETLVATGVSGIVKISRFAGDDM